MAEEVVIGNVGGDGVASEVTLQRLTTAIQAMSKKAGIDPKDATKKLKELSTATEDTIKISNKNRDALKSNTTEVDNATSAAKRFGQGLAGALASVIGTLAGSVVGLTKSILNGDNRISQFAQHLPFVGEELSQLTGILDTSIDSFRAMAMTGASFNHSITEMRMAAVNSHMSLEDFTSMVVQNSDKLAGLGGTVTQGALFISKMNKGLGQTRLDLMNLGLSTTDVNEALLDYAHLTRAGGRQRLTDDRAAAEQGQAAARYTKSLLTLSKLTGEDVKALQEKNAAAQQSLAFQMKLATLDVKQREKINADLAIVTATGGQAMTEAFQAEFLGMPPMTEAARQFVAINTDGYALVQKSVADALSASVSIEENAANAGALQVGILQSQFDMAKNLSTQLSMVGAGGDVNIQFDAMFAGKGELLAGFITEQGTLNVEAAKQAVKTAQETSDSTKTIVDPIIEAANKLVLTAAAVQIKLEEDVKGPLINAAAGAVKAISDQIAKIPDSQIFKDAMSAAKTSIEGFGGALDKLVTDLETKGPVATIMSTMLAGAEALWDSASGWQKAMLIGATALFALNGAIGIALTAGATAMFSKMIMPGGGDGAFGGGKGGGGKGKLGWGRKLLGGIKGGVGGLLGGLALDYAGSKAEEAGHKKTAAGLDIGSAALSGAGMGAMLGSVVPGVGNVVGGAVGGVLGAGYGLYQNWGKLAGSDDAESLTTPSAEGVLPPAAQAIINTPNLKENIAALNSLDNGAVLRYTDSMEKLVEVLSQMNDELSKDNKWGIGTGENAGSIMSKLNSIGGSGAGSDQLNNTMQQVVTLLTQIKGFEETTARNTRNITSGNIARSGVSNVGP